MAQFMKKSMLVSLALGALMVSSAAVTKVITPSVKMADSQGQFSLAAMVPKSFGDWREDTSIIPLQVDPTTQAKLDKIYNQTLSRTYVNRAGQRIMLSIAYGGDQSDTMSLHKPEVCYTAQGFSVSGAETGSIDTGYGALPVKRLFAAAGARNEPITYWVTIGRKATLPGMQQRMQELRYGLTGMVPDGMLVRISSIGADSAAAYAQQESFILAMLGSMDAAARARLIGVFEA
jgi:EpsI family protein